MMVMILHFRDGTRGSSLSFWFEWAEMSNFARGVRSVPAEPGLTGRVIEKRLCFRQRTIAEYLQKIPKETAVQQGVQPGDVVKSGDDVKSGDEVESGDEVVAQPDNVEDEAMWLLKSDNVEDEAMWLLKYNRHPHLLHTVQSAPLRPAIEEALLNELANEKWEHGMRW